MQNFNNNSNKAIESSIKESTDEGERKIKSATTLSG